MGHTDATGCHGGPPCDDPKEHGLVGRLVGCSGEKTVRRADAARECKRDLGRVPSEAGLPGSSAQKVELEVSVRVHSTGSGSRARRRARAQLAPASGLAAEADANRNAAPPGDKISPHLRRPGRSMEQNRRLQPAPSTINCRHVRPDPIPVGDIPARPDERFPAGHVHAPATVVCRLCRINEGVSSNCHASLKTLPDPAKKMPLHRASCQGQGTLREYFLEVSKHSDAHIAQSGRSMILLLEKLRESVAERAVWGLTSHNQLKLLAADDPGATCFVSITPPVTDVFIIEYLLPKSAAPWPNARIIGETRSIPTAVSMIIAALDNSGGWKRK